MIQIEVDAIKRQITVRKNSKDIRIIKEFERIEKIFLEGTQDKYECELVLLEVPVQTEEMMMNPEPSELKMETRAFARRVGAGFENWLENINESDFVL